MNKNKVIDLLVKIANGEEVPKKIKKIDLFTLYKEDMERTEILQNNFIEINDKINEIIDVINEDKDE